MPAPTLASTAISVWNNITTAPEPTTTSLSWSSGDRILVFGFTEDQGFTLSTPTATGLTFAALGTAVTTTNSCWMHTWTATAASSGSSVITAAGTGSTAMRGLIAFAYSGSTGFGGRAAPAAANTQTASLTRTGANSAVAFAFADWAAAGLTGLTWTPSGATADVTATTANATAGAAHWGDQGAAGTTNYGTSGLPGNKFTRIAVEILGTTSSSASGTGTISQTNTVTSTGSKTASGTGSITQTADTVTSSGVKQGAGAGSITQTNDITGSGSAVVEGRSGTGSITQTADTVTGSGSKTAVSGTGEITQTNDITGSGDAVGSTVTYHFPSDVGWTPTGGFTDSTPFNIGTYFGLTADATITGLRFWAPAATTFTAQLWADGVKVRETTGVSAGSAAWTEVIFSTPVAGVTTSEYIVSVLQPTGTAQYTGRSNSFGTGATPDLITVGPAFSNTVTNGVFTTSGTAIPSTAFNASWYGVDAIVETAAGGEEKSGTGSITEAAGEVTSSGSKMGLGTAEIIEAEPTLTGAGVKLADGTGEITQTNDITGSGSAVSESRSGTGSISQASSLTASGTKSASGTGSISEVSFMGSSGFKMAIGGGYLDFYSEVTGSGSSTTSTNKSGTGSISQSSTVTASGTKSVGGLGAISQASVVTGSGLPVSSGQRNILITGVTEPTLAWLTTEMQSGWTSTDPTAAWGTTEAGSGWTSTEPAVSAQWTTTEPGSGTITTEPVLTYTATEPTI